MISAEALLIDFKISSLIPSGPPSLDQVRIEKAQIHLLIHAGDSSMNINLWINELNSRFGGSGSTSTPIFESRGRDLEILNSSWWILIKILSPDGLDYNRIRLKALNANLTDFKLNGDKITISVKLLNAIETGSNLAIQEFKTDFYLFLKGVRVCKIWVWKLLKVSSKISFDWIHLAYCLFKFHRRGSNHCQPRRIQASPGRSKTIRPTLPEIDDEIYLTGKVTGPVSDLKSEEFLVRIGQKTAIFGSFELDGLPEISKTYINLSLKNSTILARRPFTLSSWIDRERNPKIK